MLVMGKLKLSTTHNVSPEKDEVSHTAVRRTLGKEIGVQTKQI